MLDIYLDKVELFYQTQNTNMLSVLSYIWCDAPPTVTQRFWRCFERFLGGSDNSCYPCTWNPYVMDSLYDWALHLDHNYQISQSLQLAAAFIAYHASEENLQFGFKIVTYLAIFVLVHRLLGRWNSAKRDATQAVKRGQEELMALQWIGHASAPVKAVLVSKYDKYSADMTTYAVQIMSTSVLPKGLLSYAFLRRWLPYFGLSSSIQTEMKAMESLSKRAFFSGAQCLKQDAQNVYFIRKLPPGRILSKVFAKSGPMKKDRVRSVAAQLVTTIEAAHEQALAIGDVTPDALYVDEKNRLHIIPTEPLTWKLCSTMENKAQARQVQEKDLCADWFALAQCLVAMIAGKWQPNAHPADVIRQIIKTPNTVIEDLITKLTSVSCDQKMPSIVKNHQFFTGIEWVSYKPGSDNNATPSPDDVTQHIPDDDANEIYRHLAHFQQ